MSKQESTALAIVPEPPAKHVAVTSSSAAEILKQVPTRDDCTAMSATEIHKTYIDAQSRGCVSHLTAKIALVDIKMRLQRHEIVGGCSKLGGSGGYVDRHIRKPTETLPNATRKAYLMLAGEGVNPKFDSGNKRKSDKTRLTETYFIFASGVPDTTVLHRLTRYESLLDAKTARDKAKFSTKSDIMKVIATYTVTQEALHGN